MNEKLAVRARIKARKPHFVRQDAHRFKGKMGEVWRKPRGHHSKMRLHKKGKAAMVNNGYRCPKEVRGMTKDGYVPMFVFNTTDLEKVGPKHIALVGASVGKRKRLEIITAAQKRGIKILNIKDLGLYKERAQKEIDERKKTRVLRAAKKEKKEIKKEKKTLEDIGKKENESEASENAKKEAERREAEKVMIQK